MLRQNRKIQDEIFIVLIVLAISIVVIISSVSIIVDIKSEQKRIDENLINIAGTIAGSEFVLDELSSNDSDSYVVKNYMDTLKTYLTNVDVISVISSDGTRCYHTNSNLIGTTYDGTVPDFLVNGNVYIRSDVGPSGSQRRAYAAVYDSEGRYLGFVLVVLLNQHINRIVGETILIHLLVVVFCLILCSALSASLSSRIKHKLKGYEPDVFSAMYSVRDSVLESLEEGIVAIDKGHNILFMNSVAKSIMGLSDDALVELKENEFLSLKYISKVLSTGDRIIGINTNPEGKNNAIVNYYPITELNTTIGVLCILVDRTEYTKMMEDLTGVNYLVDSMRASNHDFTNKLHVILGLVQMQKYQETCDYISDVTMVKQVQMSNIMRNIDNPSIAALLIGKQARAAELDIEFILEAGSSVDRNHFVFSTGDVITIIGNLIENSMDAIDSCDVPIKTIKVGLYSQKESLLIKVDDSGPGIPLELREKLFDKGATTKGKDRGTGLFVVKELVEKIGGSITVDSEVGEGTLISVWLNGGDDKDV